MLIAQIGGAARVLAQFLGPDIGFGASSPDVQAELDAAWIVHFTDRPSGEVIAAVPVALNVCEAELLWALMDGLAESVPLSWRFWGEPFPPCDVHTHPARICMSLADDGEPTGVALCCPADGHVAHVVTV